MIQTYLTRKYHLQYGAEDGATTGEVKMVYSKMDLYACRLWTRVLGSDEMNKEYKSTIAYREYLKGN